MNILLVFKYLFAVLWPQSTTHLLHYFNLFLKT